MTAVAEIKNKNLTAVNPRNSHQMEAKEAKGQLLKIPTC